jgi:hypothetical protein
MITAALSGSAAPSGGLTLTRFGNTALRGAAAAAPAQVRKLA